MWRDGKGGMEEKNEHKDEDEDKDKQEGGVLEMVNDPCFGIGIGSGSGPATESLCHLCLACPWSSSFTQIHICISAPFTAGGVQVEERGS
jgi:hypothetical protein